MQTTRLVLLSPLPSSRSSPRVRGGWFSLGTVIARATGRSGVLPWVLSGGILALLAFADVLSRGGSIDFIMLGLAAYELLIGLTEDVE